MPNGELSGSPSGWRVYSPSPMANRSNDLFGRANQRVVGLIGRGAPRNSPFGRAQRDRTFEVSRPATDCAICTALLRVGWSDWFAVSLSFFSPQAHIEMDAGNPLCQCNLLCRSLKLGANFRCQSGESWPVRETTSHAFSLERRCYQAVERYLHPVFCLRKSMPFAKKSVIAGVSQKQVQGFTSCPPILCTSRERTSEVFGLSIQGFTESSFVSCTKHPNVH